MIKLLQKDKLSKEERSARNEVVPGVKLYGYLGGLFGRNSYGIKTVVSVTDSQIVATERVYNGDYGDKYATVESRGIGPNYGGYYNWVDIVKRSNEALEEESYKDDESD